MRISDWSSDVCSSDLQEGDDQDERQIVPVGNVDVRLLAPRERAQIKDEIGHPDDDEPDIGIPFRLGIFLRLGDTHEIAGHRKDAEQIRSEEHTSELQSLMRISYAVFCLKKKKKLNTHITNTERQTTYLKTK